MYVCIYIDIFYTKCPDSVFTIGMQSFKDLIYCKGILSKSTKITVLLFRHIGCRCNVHSLFCIPIAYCILSAIINIYLHVLNDFQTQFM